jgi:hypothetical protein
MPLSLRQIIKNTPSNRRRAAASVVVKAIKIKTHPTSGRPLVMAKTLSRETIKGKKKPVGSANTYVTTIEVAGKYAIVGCSCQDFLYTFEWTLNKQKAARIEYSNGESSFERNPAQIAGACKHVVALGEKLIEEGKL